MVYPTDILREVGGEVIVLYPFNIQNWHFFYLIRKWHTYANKEIIIVNKDLPIPSSVHHLEHSQGTVDKGVQSKQD